MPAPSPDLSSQEFSPVAPLRAQTYAAPSTGRTSTESRRRLLELRRLRSLTDKLVAVNTLSVLQQELDNLDETSGWWIKGHLPDSLAAKAGNDLVYEVDSHTLVKRGGREVSYRDYYVLFHDLSQIVLEVSYEKDDPREKVRVDNVSVRQPQPRVDLLAKYSHVYGAAVANTALQWAAQATREQGLAVRAFEYVRAQHPELVPLIGGKAFGSVVYKNVNQTVTKVDEIRPGDIVCMRNAKFSHGLTGLQKTTVGDSELYAAVVAEYDAKKNKLRVVDTDSSGVARRESHRLSEFKSGQIRVYRVVDKEYVGWDN